MKCCNCNVVLAVDIAGVTCQGLHGVCVCGVGKMAKDIGITICKSIVVSFLPCLVAFLAFHPFHFFLMFFFVTCFCCFFGGQKTMDRCGCTVAACSYIIQTIATQMYNYSRDSYSSKTTTDNCKAMWAKIAGRRNTQHRKRGGYRLYLMHIIKVSQV